MKRRSNITCFSSAKRTQVIDDASDYFDTKDKWISQKQRKNLEKLEKQKNEKRDDKNQKITIDFAGRRVYNDQAESNDRL